MATCAAITGATIAPGQAEDSVSFLPFLQGQFDQPCRAQAVIHGAHGPFALRHDDWVYIDGPTGCDRGNEEPGWFQKERGAVPHDFTAELYNLREDLGQRHNRLADEPTLAAELKAALITLKG
ncbi:MAG: hypothetical protein ACFBZ8_01350 [Opitutales bacterium]